MRLQKLIAATVLLACAALFSGCAELNRRGGTADMLEDIVFRADTKSHRLLRSYVLTGVLMGIAEHTGTSPSTKAAIAAHLQASLSIIRESFQCLYPHAIGTAEQADPVVKQYGGPGGPAIYGNYPSPHWCQFFDEKMRRLDHSIFYLALLTLFNEDRRGLLADIQSRMVGRIPVLSEGMKAVLSANRAIKDTTTLIDDLLNLSISSFGPAAALLPLYRDAVELNGWIITDNLAIACYHQNSSTRDSLANFENHSADTPNKSASTARIRASYAQADDGASSIEHTPLQNDLRYIPSGGNACGLYREALAVLDRGHANPDALRSWIYTHAPQLLKVEAYPSHFYVVTKFVLDGCKRLLEDKCKEVYEEVLGKNVTFPDTMKFETRHITAFLHPATRHAGQSIRIPVARKKPTVSDPVSTGSIPRTQ